MLASPSAACPATSGLPETGPRSRVAALEGGVLPAQQGATEWGQGMAIHASAVGGITAAVQAAEARAAAAAQERREAEATAREAPAARKARKGEQAIAKKVAEVRALEEALALERARKEAEEKAHQGALANAEVDAAKGETIEAARRKVAKERAKTKAEIRALEAEKAQLQRVCQEETACAREEAERRAAEATAVAMEKAGKQMKRKTPSGGFCVDTLRRLFEVNSASRMKMYLDAKDSRSSASSDRAPHYRRKGKAKTLERARRPAEGHPDDSNPLVISSGMDETAGIAESPRARFWEGPELAAEEATAPLQIRKQRASQLRTAVGKAPHVDPHPEPDSVGQYGLR